MTQNETVKHARIEPDGDDLTPRQISRLIYGDWEGQAAAVVVNKDLSLTDLGNAEILVNARVFLRVLLESSGTKVTETGNLSRKFVRQMVEAMSWPPGYVDDLESLFKVWNERDVFLLHILRVILTLAGLIRKFKGSFRITKRGERLLQDPAAGELYVTLFQTFFRKFNLAYLDGCPECPGVQETVAYSVFMFGRHATNWVSPKQLAQKLFLPIVLAEMPINSFGSNDQVVLSETRILLPLARFGLVEWQHPEDGGFIRSRNSHFRKTGLFDAFLEFELGDD